MERNYTNGKDANKKISPHNFILLRGKFTGKRITRVPVKYLVYLINHSIEYKEVAKMELDRRKCPIPKIDVTAHAIDQASIRLNKRWHDLRNREEGIFSWLLRVGERALVNGTFIDGDRIAYKKMIFVFDIRPEMPILKTVMLNPKSNTKGRV